MQNAVCESRTTCRLCASDTLELVLRLAATPPANAFAPSAESAIAAERYPLDVMRCERCGHVQLAHVVDATLLFTNYVYVSGTSPTFVRHFEEYAAQAVEVLGLTAGALVADIGSNDGTLLRAFQDRQCRVRGIDPAKAISEAANAAGIATLNAFFSAAIAADLRTEMGAADLIVANNVCAHIDDLDDVVAGVAHWLSPRGEFWFEVSYLKSVLEGTLFDTIYHEHLDYHHLLPLLPFFARHGLELWDAEEITPHGGSIRVRVARQGVRQASARLGALLEAERQAGLDTPAPMVALQTQIDRLGNELNTQLDRFAAEGLRGGGYGAPAKATTLMHQFGIDGTRVGFIVDDSPWKQDLFSPGLGVPIVAADYARAAAPAYLLVLAWNFADPIIRNNQWLLDQGGRFVVPVPDLRLIGPH